MKCDEVREQLADMALGRLDTAFEMTVRGHCLECAACDAEYQALRRMQAAIDILPELEPSPALRDRIMVRYRAERQASYSDRLRAVRRAHGGLGYFVRWIGLQVHRPEAAAACIAAVILLGFAAVNYSFWSGAGQASIDPAATAKLPSWPAAGPVNPDYYLSSREAHKRVSDELLAVDELDVPEQAWRRTDMDLDGIRLEPTEAPDHESDVVRVPAVVAPSPAPATAAAALYGNRYLRDRALACYEGDNVQGLVTGGLEWLARSQNTDGSWGPAAERTFVTGLAGLAFMADVGMLDVLGYRATVDRACAYIRTQCAADHVYAGTDGNARRAHVVALNFLVEYAALTGDNALREEVRPGLAALFDMGAAVGWEANETQFRADRSLTGWYILLMASVRRSGYDLDRLFVDRARSWVTQATYGGREGAAPTEDQLQENAVRAAAAFMGRYFLDEKRDKDDLRSIARDLYVFFAERITRDGVEQNPYFLYFAALGLFQDHGTEWFAFNRAVKGYLARTAAQAEYFGAKAGTYWPAKGRRYEAEGDAFHTAIAVLTLQTYYRYRIIE
ncbi:MAG: hypothetical protein ABIF71_12215 [Planctomycetota bacterium]